MSQFCIAGRRVGRRVGKLLGIIRKAGRKTLGVTREAARKAYARHPRKGSGGRSAKDPDQAHVLRFRSDNSEPRGDESALEPAQAHFLYYSNDNSALRGGESAIKPGQTHRVQYRRRNCAHSEANDQNCKFPLPLLRQIARQRAHACAQKHLKVCRNS